LAIVVCAACGTSNTSASQFCNGCGLTLTAVSVLAEGHTRSYTPAHLVTTTLSSRSAIEGERKLATILFCDIVNSTALAARVGAEAMHGILNRFFELALAEVHRYEGTVNQFLGDGLMALFGAPRAHEDHARQAALAALSIQRLVHDRFSQLLDVGEPLELRMGLNTGLVVLGSIGDNLRRDYTAVGDTTNVAARLQQHAEPGVILASDTTAGLLAGYMRMESAGSLQVKGRTESVLVHRILGLGPRRSPLERWSRPRLSPFVDRERELEVLRGILARVEDGHGQAVGIAAEAGMGKSRLLYEFRRSMGAKRLTYLEGRCLSAYRTRRRSRTCQSSTSSEATAAWQKSTRRR
jgi:class 3 adenylate cyclase